MSLPLRAPWRRRPTHGLTLLELMIALVLLAVVASIAYPSYRAQVEKGRIAQAVREIQEMSLVLERSFSDKGKYPASLSDVGLARNDPWGNAYQYLNMAGASVGDVRKDKSLHPLNTDYDLYSKGPDGDTAKPLTSSKSQDDIVRANNGGFVGLGKDY